MNDSLVKTEPYAGKDLGEDSFAFTQKMIEDYCDGLALDRAGYLSAADAATPAMAVSQVDVGYDGARFANDFGNLWIRQEWAMHRPILRDREYRRTSTILDIYDWRGRSVVKQEVSVFDDDDLVVSGIHHQSWLLTQSTGKLALRDPKKKEGARKFAVPEGEPIAGLGRSIDLEMCGVFFHGRSNYHTDKQASEELGFEEVVVGGRMTMSLVGQMLEQHFGQGFSEGGRLDVKFTNIVWPGDHVTAKGVITGRQDGRADATVWMEKDDGTVVIVGTASAAV